MASADGRVDILMVEDNPNDEELTLHELRKYHLANTIQVVRDGQEALEYIFCTGRFADRDVNEHCIPPLNAQSCRQPGRGRFGEGI